MSMRYLWRLLWLLWYRSCMELASLVSLAKVGRDWWKDLEIPEAPVAVLVE